MEILLGLIVLLGGLMIGVRHGGIGLAVINGIAVVIFTFVFGYKPGKPISMVLVIQMVMMMVGAFILLGSKVKAKDIPNSNVFRAGMVALVTVYGVAWAADTYFSHHMPIIKEVLGEAVQIYPWAYAVVLFTASVLINSQGAAIAIVTPMALTELVLLRLVG